MKYKMVTCDLDGTLYNSKDKISDENNKAISEFKKLGIPFVPCTGRTLSEMKELCENPDIRYIIYSSGAAILDKKTGEHTSNSLSHDVKKKLLSDLSPFDYYYFIHADGNCYVDGKLKGKEKEYKLNETLRYLADNVALAVDDFEKEFLSMEVECLAVFFKTDEDREKCKKIIVADERIFAAEPWPRNFEIFDAKAGKGNAIKELAKKLGVDLSEVISVGDSDNDIGALKTAGLGIAVSNGSEEIKRIADEIACSNDEHVAEYVLKRYFL